MRQHIKNVHEGVKPTKHCDNCKKAFQHSISLSHQRVCKILDYSGTQICCKLCGDKLTNHSVKHHWKSHPSEIETLKCNFCDKIFIQAVHRKAHEKSIHQKIKEFGCKLCPQKFVKSGSVKDHMKTKLAKNAFLLTNQPQFFFLDNSSGSKFPLKLSSILLRFAMCRMLNDNV